MHKESNHGVMTVRTPHNCFCPRLFSSHALS